MNSGAARAVETRANVLLNWSCAPRLLQFKAKNLPKEKAPTIAKAFKFGRGPSSENS
jgi:hypothetical protein